MNSVKPTLSSVAVEAASSVAAAVSEMASSTSAAPAPSNLSDALNDGAGTAQQNQGTTIASFLASLASAFAIFGLELAVFLLISGKLSRIYFPRTFLVPEKERTAAPPKGIWPWIPSVFKTSNSEFIQKCGLDAYFFLRYLRTLLKIFIPCMIVILPILLPLNIVGGRGPNFATGQFGNSTTWTNADGLDRLGWGNVSPLKNDRYWAHLLLALAVIIYTCWVFFDELRGYIRLRQAYLTSPQHRLRASATTVLVTAIPTKWCTHEALDGLYDVFPGGIRNIWINRNFDDLNEKIKRRDKLAQSLEKAETNLIKNAKKAATANAKKEAKKRGSRKPKSPILEQSEAEDQTGLSMAQGDGVSAGDPHQVKHTIDELLDESSDEPSRQRSPERNKPLVPIPVIGAGVEAVGHGLEQFGEAVFGKKNTSHKEKAKEASRPEKRDKEQKKQGPTSVYPPAFDDTYDPNEGSPKWKQYLKEKDRETMRLPIFGWQWMIALPLVGKKVDTIYYCRKEVARLNLEIEEDQKHPERYPLMNSAFVQFNHQVAAHMACQSVSHHSPNQMAPRVVEISPNDVIWDNMSTKWWEAYIRTAVVLVVIIGLILGWAVPVSFTGFLSNISNLESFNWLKWIEKVPHLIISIIQGILPPALLALLLVLLPLILRFLARVQGSLTGMAVELTVQRYYFAFLFVQLFLVVSISSGITRIIQDVAKAPQSVASLLASNLPKASNYFFSYMLLQAFSTSGGALVQLGGLFKWYLLAPLMDSTARQKWKRQIQLPDMKWGTFFPVYTNLACIGLIYSVVSPLILVFNIVTFSLFWFVYRYNTLYVTKFTFDTGGLLFPTAINQLFTGIYVMEICLIGLFLLVRDVGKIENGKAEAAGTPCKIQAIIMIVALILTIIFQWLLNNAFGPLLRYLPITLEDEAVMRDEEFARAQEKRWALEEAEEEHREEHREERREASMQGSQDRETRSRGYSARGADSYEMHSMEGGPDLRSDLKKLVPHLDAPVKLSWATRDPNKSRKSQLLSPAMIPQIKSPRQRHHHQKQKAPADVENQTGTDRMAAALFSGINDEIEDLTPDDRDKLVQRAFQHTALRARRPVIWIPRDDLGISDDEVKRTKESSGMIWISNEGTALDAKGRVIYRRSPPDFSEVDLIDL